MLYPLTCSRPEEFHQLCSYLLFQRLFPVPSHALVAAESAFWQAAKPIRESGGRGTARRVRAYANVRDSAALRHSGRRSGRS